MLGCIKVFAQTQVQKPKADFTSNITSGCAPISVAFSDASTGNPTSWSWDLGTGGGTSSLKNPSALYLTPGTYTIRLIATNAAGSDTIVKTAYINALAAPQASFSANKTIGCGPTTVQFSDLSTAAAGTSNSSWFWDFGDGTNSTQQNPSKTYSDAGVYTVTLRVTNNVGCSHVFTRANYISVSSGVIADFKYTEPTTCGIPVAINFSNFSEGPGALSYVWNFGDGSPTVTTPEPSHNYTTRGKYTVTLTTTSDLGCSNTVQKEINVGTYITDFTVPKICFGASVQLTNASSPEPLSSLWVFPDGTTSTETNPSKILSISGDVQIKLINDYGPCRDSIIKTVTVTAKPALSFSTNDNIKCAPSLVVNFTNTSGATTYLWKFGDSTTSTAASPSHTYNQYGNFDVTLIGTTDGCSDTLTRPGYIQIQRPQISFPGLPATGCIPYTQSFNAAINTLDNVLSYQWNFGDGTTSNQPNPSHTYTQRGTYNVSLTITTSTGCTETYTLGSAIRVGSKPVANFSIDKTTEMCASDSLYFTDLSTPANEVNEWLWLFSDNSQSILQNPAHMFGDTGMVSVRFVAYNNGCPSDTLRRDNLIRVKPPIAQFTFTPDCNNRNRITFTNNSIFDPALPTTWSWDFGDGSAISTAETPPVHAYPITPRSWPVSLTVTNGSCSYTFKDTVNVTDPALDFTVPAVEGCRPFNASFQASSATPFVSTLWDFGDGNTQNVSGGSVTHTYSNTGIYTVIVTSTDEFGCQYTKTKAQYIKVNGVTADFVSSLAQGCKGFKAVFEDRTTTDGTHPITNWKWNFGDGKTQTFTKAPFEHVYDTTGTFSVSLEVKDSYGCVDSIRKSDFVTASGLKAAWESVTETCPGSPVQFINRTKGSTYNSSWEFGDGNSSTDKVPNYAYVDTGIYTVKLKVSDATGCEDSLVKQNYLKVGVPVASFTANNFTTFCTPFQAGFVNTSSYYTERFWNLAIATSRQENPTLFYTATGTYDISLVVTSPGGCKDTMIQQLKVFNPADASITYGPSLEGCRPIKLNFEAFADMDARFVWDFGDGNVIDTSSNKIEHTYNDFGPFTPRIIMTEATGNCKVTLVGSQVINVYGSKAKFGINNTLFCDSTTLQIRDSSTYFDDNVVYNWNYGDGTSSTNPKDSVHFYSSPGYYDVLLTINTAHGCVDSLRSKTIKISQSPLIDIVSDTVICVNERMRHAGVFLRSDTAVVKWKWEFPNGNTATVQNPAMQQYSKAGNYQLNTIATNSDGCFDTDTVNLLVHPLPTAELPAVVNKQAGFPVTIPAVYQNNVVGYSWYPDSTLNCNDCPQPTTTTKFDTKLTVTYVDSNHCFNSSEVQVIVFCKNANVFIPNTFSPNGDGSNDVLYVRGRGLERVRNFRVFNRWGEVVFEQRDLQVNNQSFGWDGMYKGKKAQADVYVYQIEVFCENSQILRFEGNVALIQ